MLKRRLRGKRKLVLKHSAHIPPIASNRENLKRLEEVDSCSWFHPHFCTRDCFSECYLYISCKFMHSIGRKLRFTICSSVPFDGGRGFHT